MRLEVLLLAGRRTNELLAELARLEAYEELAVQIWVDESDENQIERVRRACSDNSRYQAFTHRGAQRADRILHSASHAQGDLQLELRPGVELDPRGLAELAELPGDTLFLASPLSPQAEVADLELAELLDPERTALQFAVAPTAVTGHRALVAHAALDVATYFICAGHSGARRLSQPLLRQSPSDELTSLEREARAAWCLQRLSALNAAARATGHGGSLAEPPLAPLGAAWLDALRALGTERNPEQLAGRFPLWRSRSDSRSLVR